MMFIGTFPGRTQLMRVTALAALTLALAACATTDDVTGSTLAQPPPGGEPRKPVDAHDITIVGQEVAHAILDLPAIANAAVPPMVQFSGVTSIVVGPAPVDTDPYTSLLRDRLLLLTRLKLRFMEKTLPPLVIASKKGKSKKAATPPKLETPSTPDYRIVAELRGKYKDEFYRIQVQFIDLHTNEVLFDGLYTIKKEGPDQDTPPDQEETTQLPPPDPNVPIPPPEPPSMEPPAAAPPRSAPSDIY